MNGIELIAAERERQVSADALPCGCGTGLIAWQLSPEAHYGDKAGKFIVTSADGLSEVGSVLFDTREECVAALRKIRPCAEHRVVPACNGTGEAKA